MIFFVYFGIKLLLLIPSMVIATMPLLRFMPFEKRDLFRRPFGLFGHFIDVYSLMLNVFVNSDISMDE